ncbi:dihydropteroate synthase [Pelotomaculum propionicicum]|uniref:5-methyltetrahydrofolate:corrinoid/iron-sulfur protein co-methyltransferase n=1 Tax=Pelotomaculum propionicicum TaxID=258475 RepID=A0A4Y7RVU7_9FIRM|nr:dihydropteroate synthase [Pelotomaculum propionicicum]NLI12344.1 dihydropteroate synthase [Peptococcaceae bacterium]TEB13031.1 5-methyltetrahydrofolate:corrinoid/iron-sulfur protein co-methyltransferase [Pelotomaculum propionicicum]
METRLASAARELMISSDKQTTLIGERINPTGKKKLAEALQKGEYDEIVRREAREQVDAGADVLDVNVGAGGVDEIAVLPEVVKIVMDEVDVPLCIDSGNPHAIEAALKVYKGKPLINSVKGEEQSLQTVLPLVKEYGAAVIALPLDQNGIPNNADDRIKLVDRIVERCVKTGIPIEDIVIDCLALSVGVDYHAGLVTLETIKRVKENYGVNMTLGASNISFSLPGREAVNDAFLSIAMAAGVTCPVVNVAKARKCVLSTDLILGRDKYALRYIKYYRQNKEQF